MAAADQSSEPFKERQTDAWHRHLPDGRIEFMVKTPGYRMRATLPEEQAWQAVEMFEDWTGLRIESDRRPPRKTPVPPGQLPMTELEMWPNE